MYNSLLTCGTRDFNPFHNHLQSCYFVVPKLRDSVGWSALKCAVWPFNLYTLLQTDLAVRKGNLQPTVSVLVELLDRRKHKFKCIIGKFPCQVHRSVLYAQRKKTKHIPNQRGYNPLDPWVSWILSKSKQLVGHSFRSWRQMWCQFRLWMQILLLHLLRQSNMIATLLLKCMMKQKSQKMVKTHWKSF